MADADLLLKTLVTALQAKLGRLPTEDEVMAFIYGEKAEREAIWNSQKEVSDEA